MAKTQAKHDEDIADNSPPWDSLPRFTSKAELQEFYRKQLKALETEDHSELMALAKDVQAQLDTLNKKLGRSYGLQDLYFKTRTIESKKAGIYVVGNKEIEWSGKGKRPAELKGLSDKELEALKKK